MILGGWPRKCNITFPRPKKGSPQKNVMLHFLGTLPLKNVSYTFQRSPPTTSVGIFCLANRPTVEHFNPGWQVSLLPEDKPETSRCFCMVALLFFFLLKEQMIQMFLLSLWWSCPYFNGLDKLSLGGSTWFRLCLSFQPMRHTTLTPWVAVYRARPARQILPSRSGALLQCHRAC